MVIVVVSGSYWWTFEENLLIAVLFFGTGHVKIGGILYIPWKMLLSQSHIVPRCGVGRLASYPTMEKRRNKMRSEIDGSHPVGAISAEGFVCATVWGGGSSFVFPVLYVAIALSLPILILDRHIALFSGSEILWQRYSRDSGPLS